MYNRTESNNLLVNIKKKKKENNMIDLIQKKRIGNSKGYVGLMKITLHMQEEQESIIKGKQESGLIRVRALVSSALHDRIIMCRVKY